MPNFPCTYFVSLVGGGLCSFSAPLLFGVFSLCLLPVGGLLGQFLCSLVMWVSLWLSAVFCAVGLVCLFLLFAVFYWWPLFGWAWFRVGVWLLGLGGFPVVAWPVGCLVYCSSVVVFWCFVSFLVSGGSDVFVAWLLLLFLAFVGFLGFVVLTGCVWCLLSVPLWFCGAMMKCTVATGQGFCILWTSLPSLRCYPCSLPAPGLWSALCSPELGYDFPYLFDLGLCPPKVSYVGWGWSVRAVSLLVFCLADGVGCSFLASVVLVLFLVILIWSAFLSYPFGFSLVRESVCSFLPWSWSFWSFFFLFQLLVLDCSAGLFLGFPGRADADAEKRLITFWIVV